MSIHAMSDILDSKHAAVTFRSLGASGRVMFCSDACLDLRPARLACAQCREACPVGALRSTADGTTLAESCVGCGRCAAACPTGALHVDGFRIEPASSEARRIECQRVPRQLSQGAAIVPCAGGLSADLLLELQARAPGQWLFVDRGWCTACVAGTNRGGTVFDGFDEAARILGELGVPATQNPKVVQDHIPIKFARAIDEATAGPRVSRRGFLGALVRQAVETAERSTAPTVQLLADRGACKPSLVIRERQTQYSANIRKLAASQGQTISAAQFPQIEIAGHCDHSGLCAAVCPTGAVRRYADGQAIGLEFEADACIGCGLCAQRCPNLALTMLPAGNATTRAQSGAARLTRHEIRECTRCGTQFPGAGAHVSRCPRCQIEQNLARSLFSQSPVHEPRHVRETGTFPSNNFTAL